MKNRLLAYGFGTPQKSAKPKQPAPSKKQRQRKGKRLICRILERWSSADGTCHSTDKLCIYVAAPGEYYVRGRKVSARQALRGYLIWRFEDRGEIVDDFVDEREMKLLRDSVLPYERDPIDDGVEDKDDGEDWKTA